MSDTAFQKALTEALIQDRKRERRWKIIRFSIIIVLVLIYTLLIFGIATPSKAQTHKNYAALINLNGEIASNKPFSAAKIIPALNAAFRDAKAKGIVLAIDSPGGSPVQASIIHDKIIQLKKRFHKKVVVVAYDSLASGAYLVATAADKIYVNPDTLTGSIGVIMNGFGFTDAIKKLGITRRVYTAGLNKDQLDPFKPANPVQIKRIKRLLNQVHQNFIDDVIQGRGKRLTANKKVLFNGDFWVGTQAVKLGLADKTGNLWNALKDEFDVEYVVNYSPKPSFFHELTDGMQSMLPVALTKQHVIVKAEL